MLIKSMLVSFCLLFSVNANAHLLKIFAFTKETNNQQTLTTSGKVYFAGGAGIPNASVQVIDNQGVNIKKVTSDKNGKFSVELAQGNYQLIADTQDGHIAKWQIKGSASNAVTKSPKNSISQNVTTTALPSPDSAQLLQLNNIIAEQLARQILPLSEQINTLQEKAKFQDILGGLGYIFGLYGFAMWWRQRKT
ncbi:MAG: carboxypeptidase-like regulatory domain-containing protein [Oceanospirillaceae bacterium]